jgi:hypothetical protein
MHAVRARNAPRADGGVQHGIVRGVEDAVAEASQRGNRQQRPVRRGQRSGGDGGAEERHARKEHAARADVIDQETRRAPRATPETVAAA